MPMSLNPSCRSGGRTSQIFLLSCFWSPFPQSRAPPTVFSREPPSPLGALRSPETTFLQLRAPLFHPGAPHLALLRASSATCGNPLSARSGTVSRPRATPPRNRTGPGHRRRERSVPGGSAQIEGASRSGDAESARELSGRSDPFLDTSLHTLLAHSTTPSPEAAALLRWQRPRAQARSRTRAPGLGA